jgi:A/G-specific adenine glycosylase
VAHALVERPATRGAGRAVLLERRRATETVMPGMWQLPMLCETSVPEADLRLEVRHAIMQVNYRVKVRTVAESDVAELTVEGGERRWVRRKDLNALPLTGLARKVLAKMKLLAASS